MKHNFWFRKKGFIYVTAQPAGYVVTFMALLFILPVVITILKNGHSVRDDLYQVFVYGTCTVVWWKWIT